MKILRTLVHRYYSDYNFSIAFDTISMLTLAVFAGIVLSTLIFAAIR
jgi:hypothetical protein